MTDTPLDGYRRQYPDLPVRLLAFFEMGNADQSSGSLRPRTVQEFISSYGVADNQPRLQPQFVVELCRRLVSFGWLNEMAASGFSGLGNSYLGTVRNLEELLSNPSVNRLMTCAVWGFPAVYDLYRSSVVPLVHESATGVLQIGTAFVTRPDLMVTALHCITGCTKFSARGLKADLFAKARFYSHPDPTLDLACVRFSSPVWDAVNTIPVPETDAEILTEVMAMGYPDIPGFHPSLAAEAATISARMTVVRGRVASAPTELWSNAEMFLITARVRGGFSGGPVLDRFGQAVGVVSREPAAEEAGSGSGHRYDNAGYGTAVPASAIRQMYAAIDGGYAAEMNMSDVEFVEFE